MKLKPFVLIIVVFITIATGISFLMRVSIENNQDIWSLPYINYGIEKADISKIGIVKEDNRSYKGYLVYEDILVDTNGDHFLVSDFKNNPSSLNYLDPRIILEYNGSMLDKLSKSYYIHHEFCMIPNSSFLFLTKEMHKVSNESALFDTIIIVNKDLNKTYIWSSFEHLNDLIALNYQKTPKESALDYYLGENFQPFKETYNISTGNYPDYFHINSVQYIKKNLHSKDKRFREGNLLVSSRNINTVFIIDKLTGKIVWNWGADEILKQHSPLMLENGNILIFDNGDSSRNYSRVIEINPIDKKIIWEYKNKETFFADHIGFAQRLPNGNTLITDGPKGRVFEVTKNGELVYEYYTPFISKEGYREKIYRAFKIEKQDAAKLYSAYNMVKLEDLKVHD